MTISKLILRNFRGVIEGEVDLAPLTILVGSNNSGKTTILEVLLLTHGSQNLPYGLLPYSVLSIIHETLSSNGLEHLVYSYGTITSRAMIGYLHDTTLSATVIDITERLVKIHLLDKVNTLSEDAITNIVKGKTPEAFTPRFKCDLRLNPKPFIAKVLFIRNGIIKHVYNYMRRRWIELVGKGITRSTAKWVSKCLGEEYIDITAEPFGGDTEALYLYRVDGLRIRLGDLGDGVQLLISAKIMYEYSRPNLLLWDDVESHMNPRTLLLLGEWISQLVENNVQVVLTTHSYEALRTIASLAPEGKAKIVKLRLENGKLKTRYYSLSEVEELKDLGVDVRA